MKKIFFCTLLSIIILLNMCFVVYAKEQKQNQFAIYLVKDLKTVDAIKKDLKDLELEDKPILQSSQITEYNWYTHEFKLKDNSLEKALNKKVPVWGKPFVVVVGTERIYTGAFWTPLSSVYLPSIPTISSLWFPESDIRTYKIGYWGDNDKRGDLRIYASLKNQNILKEFYKIPADKIKKNYSVEDFESIYKEYLTQSGKIKTSLTLKSYDITPADVKKELNCQIFKVNNNYDSYLIYKGELFEIGIGFGGFGVTSIKTCDFDANGQKDLVYTFSWGSGLHRSQIAIFDLSKKKETHLDFVQLMEDIQLVKISNNKFNIYNAELASKDSKLVFAKKKLIAKLTSTKGNISIKHVK